MVWSQAKTQVTHLSVRKLHLLYRMKNSLTNLRNLTSSVKRSHGLCSICFSPQGTKRTYSRSHIAANTAKLFGVVPTFGTSESNARFQMNKCYSSSTGDVVKAEAPIGVQDRNTTLRPTLLGQRLGASYNHLFRHVNSYFKQKQVSMRNSDQGELLTRPPSPVQNSRCSGENIELSQEASPGIQLFHISSMVNRFGETYNHVAGHINSVFSNNRQTKTKMEVSPEIEVSRRYSRRKRRVMCNKSLLLEGTTVRQRAEVDKLSNPREEGYLQFSHHINRYFGAKVIDREHDEKHTLQAETEPSNYCKATSPLQARSPGLFHMSSLSTRFGENYSYMAKHINLYFRGSAAAEVEEEERVVVEEKQDFRPPEIVPNPNTPFSFFEGLVKPSIMADFVDTFLGRGSAHDQRAMAKEILDTTVFERKNVNDVTRILLNRLETAKEESSITSCLEELNSHLHQHPTSKAVLWQKKATLQLLRHRRRFWMNEPLQESVRETLALIGYVDPVKGRGVRVLSIDGGGTKGLVPLQVLKALEAQTGKSVHQLFDYICGVSTGAVLAFMLGLARFSLDECEHMYRRFGADVFQQNRLVGTVKMGWTHSYYNTETWEKIIREKMGEGILIKTARDELSPKVSAVSAIVNRGKSPKPFIFRNYNYSPSRLSCYSGASGHPLWKAVRASSAAPGYFQEFPLHGDIHQDGGLILNNPCAVAVHESRLLWPSQPFQCVLSLGTGLYVCAKRARGTSTSLKDKISSLICSATDTEGVHTLLDDLLPPNVYFRFNPLLSSNVSLDESRPQVLQQLQSDTQLYLERNQAKLERLCKVLTAEHSGVGKTQDWIRSRIWELQHRWT